MKQKLFTILLAVVASIGLMCAESGTCGDNLTWDLTDGVLTISGSGAMANYTYTNSAPWYSSRSSIKTVIINDGVISIGDEAFSDCSSLTSVTIPNRVTSIGRSVFYGCSSLTSITIPNSVTSIRNNAFDDCSSLTSITIPNSVTSIGNGAFYACSSLTSVTIPNSVTSIGDWAFQHCSSLISVEIPNSVASIGEETFRGCSSLTSVTIPNSVTSIGIHAFDGCRGLTSVEIPNSVTYIGSSAFFDCSSLTSVTIGNSVTSIRDYTFYDCSSLTLVTIPNSVTSIESWAFYGCRSLSSVTIPNSVTSIGNNAFGGCRGLTSVTIPNSVTSIGNNAFGGCSSLTSVTIPNSITNFGERTFYGCSSLTSPVYNAHVFAFMPTSYNGAYTIPNGIETIAGGAFYGCSSLTSVTIGNSVTSIEDYAFYGCNSLTSVTIPNSVTSIGYFAFRDCSSLTSMTIGNSVTYIGYSAFYNCSILSKIYSLPQTPPTIGSSAFDGISSDAVVYVKNSALATYQSASYWKNMNIIGLKSEAQATEFPTSVLITASHEFWEVMDDYIYQIGIKGGEQEVGNTLEYIGLEPNSEYIDIPVVLTSNTGETEIVNVSFTTTALELATQQPKVVSSTTAILLAQTNISDAEVNCGFEWKRNDAPEAMGGTKVYAPVANGTMAGRLKGLKDDVYYKYRAFYESSAGNMYYGDWQYIFTGDDAVEFEPVMYTYAPTAVTETSATLKGYALAGSDEFTEQGFEYWAESRIIPGGANNAPRRAYLNAIGEHLTVQATGISMKVTLTDLDEGTTYKYLTYAVVNGSKVYGAEMLFTTRGEYLYTVTFVDYDGTLLGSDKVHYGTAATAPEDPSREGYEFAGWDKDYSHVTDDLTVTATYSVVSSVIPVESYAKRGGAVKFLRDGQLLILRDGITYTVQGQEVKCEK